MFEVFKYFDIIHEFLKIFSVYLKFKHKTWTFAQTTEVWKLDPGRQTTLPGHVSDFWPLIPVWKLSLIQSLYQPRSPVFLQLSL